jgi:polyribonucleotide nucleotidyltransferase
LFDKAFGREIQVVPTVVSADLVNPPDILAINAASACVHISDIPFGGPIAAVRVCHVDGAYVINPTYDQIEKSALEIVVAGSDAGITMVEGGADEVSEDLMLGAIEAARKPIAEICDMIRKMRDAIGKPKLPLSPLKVELVRKAEIAAYAKGLVEKAIFTKVKHERYAAVAVAIKPIPRRSSPTRSVDEIQKTVLRVDGGYPVRRAALRHPRPGPACRRTRHRGYPAITCEIGVLTRTHGSALFTRGETQALAVNDARHDL